MTPDEFEFLLTQYADGALFGSQREAVENRLMEDPIARVQLESYRRLNEALESATGAQSVRWDVLAARISAAAADAEDRRARNRLIIWRVAMVSMAASLLLVVSIHFRPQRTQPGNPAAQIQSVRSTPIAQVFGPAIETPQGPASAVVKIGPPPLTASAAEAYPFAQGVVAEPSHISIGSGAIGDRQ